jgi:hypothetical protein
MEAGSGGCGWVAAVALVVLQKAEGRGVPL